MKCFLRRTFAYLIPLVLLLGLGGSTVAAASTQDLLFVRLPAAAKAPTPGQAGYLPYQQYVDGCQIARLTTNKGEPRVEVLTPEFVSARDPAVSFDGKHILFSGKQTRQDRWQIYRMDSSGGNKRQITREPGDCISPLYVGSLFYLNDKIPTPQITYLGTSHGWSDGPGAVPALALYACRTDGTVLRRITFNLFSDFNQDVLPNGRLVYSSRRPDRKRVGERQSVGILAVNIDGTDQMAYAEEPNHAGPPVHQVMPRVSGADSRVYYIESPLSTWLGGGALAFVSQRRPLHSRTVLAPAESGLYHSPCPLPDGGLLAAYRARGEDTLYRIHRLDPQSGERTALVHAESGYHCIDMHLLAPHPRVQGRSSVVGFRHKDTGVFFCLSSYISDIDGLGGMEPGTIKKVRVIEGLPFRLEQEAVGDNPATVSAAARRILDVAPVEADGSFHLRVPSQIPLTFQLLDQQGRALASQHSWSWVMPGESRGCIGCHEDGELVPPNVMAQALIKPEVRLLPSPEDRRSLEFLSDLAPIVHERCGSCHQAKGPTPRLNHPESAYQALVQGERPYVLPGDSYHSPLINRLVAETGEGMIHAGQELRPDSTNVCARQLTHDERTLLIEWVDLGAPFGSGTDQIRPAGRARGSE